MISFRMMRRRRQKLTPQEQSLRAETEKEFQERVRNLARALGWLVYHTHDSRRCEPGFPDLVMVRAPRLLFMELKREGGRFSQDQIHWLQELKACGVEVYTARPSAWADVERILR